jgi:hypothetical protein
MNIASPEQQHTQGPGHQRTGAERSGIRDFFKNNGLSLVLFVGFFATFWVGQSITGWHVYNQDQQDHGRWPVGYGEYLTTEHFMEATAENWESEFLQMFFYVVLTVFLYQKGSAESKRPETFELVDADPRTIPDVERADAPWPVRRGGWVLKLYEHSLSIALFLLFAISFTLHLVGGARHYNMEQIEHGGDTVSAIGYLHTSQFWFESFQNWQSEFLAIGAMVVLTIWLREKGSPESKPVHAAHDETGG